MLVESKDPVLSHPGAGRLGQLQAPPGHPHLDALDPEPEGGRGTDGSQQAPGRGAADGV